MVIKKDASRKLNDKTILKINKYFQTKTSFSKLKKGPTPFTITEAIEKTTYEHFDTYISSSQSKLIKVDL